jgi:hypothetical protein
MKHAPEQTASGRPRTGSGFLFLPEGKINQGDYENERGRCASHERVKQQTLQILSNPLSIAHEKLAREQLRNVRYSDTRDSKRSVHNRSMEQ